MVLSICSYLNKSDEDDEVGEHGAEYLLITDQTGRG